MLIRSSTFERVFHGPQEAYNGTQHISTCPLGHNGGPVNYNLNVLYKLIMITVFPLQDMGNSLRLEDPLCSNFRAELRGIVYSTV